jgi:hypothetical protein
MSELRIAHFATALEAAIHARSFGFDIEHAKIVVEAHQKPAAGFNESR